MRQERRGTTREQSEMTREQWGTTRERWGMGLGVVGRLPGAGKTHPGAPPNRFSPLRHVYSKFRKIKIPKNPVPAQGTPRLDPGAKRQHVHAHSIPSIHLQRPITSTQLKETAMPAAIHRAIEDRLNRYRTGLINARDVPELQRRVALYGYTPEKLNELLSLQQETFDLHLARKKEYGEQLAATSAFDHAWKAAHDAYMVLIRLGRVLFRDDYGVFVKLTLNQERKKSFSGWLTQARTFFAGLLADPAVLEKYAKYNTPLATIEAARELVDAAEQANTVQAKETGEARQATLDRDAKLDALDSAMSEFYALAKLACRDAPDLLDMLDR